MSRDEDIIEFAKNLKAYWRTNDPMILAATYGIKLTFPDAEPSYFKAHTIKLENYPTIISINRNLDRKSQTVLCAHELGHALLHEGINHFDVSSHNTNGIEEYEANLFAVSLLFDDREFAAPLDTLGNALLLKALNYNIER